MISFNSLGLAKPLLQALDQMGFETPTPVQEKTIPLLLEKNTDIVSLAQTGTGKTAAFGLPMLQKIDCDQRHTQGLVLSPTRELCLQITEELKNYAAFVNGVNIVAVYGGASIQDQAKNIKKGAQIIVATPGRLQDLINRNMVHLSKVDYCVLDEADEMLNMGFQEAISSILSNTPKTKNTWLFSATMPQSVAVIAKKFMVNPEEITIGERNAGTKNVSHECYTVSGRDRYPALKRLVDAHPGIFSVIFCRTKRDTQKVADKLIEDGYDAAALHGDLSQNQRDIVMKSFRLKRVQLLVATDVAARGIDVDNVTHVINYQLPDEIETYTHRSGRTGRAGNTGISMIIITQSESRKIKSIEKLIKAKVVAKKIPDGKEICESQLYHLAQKIHQTEIYDEIEEYLPQVNEVLHDLSKEELIKRLVSVEFIRFHNYYKNLKDLNSSTSTSTREESYTDRGDDVRFFINIGARDDYDWMVLKDFLRSALDLDKDDLFHVDVMDNFSFFTTFKTHQQKVESVFSNFDLDGRKIKVEVSEKKPRRKNDSFRDKKKSKGRPNRDFEGRRDKNKGKRRKHTR